MKKLTYIIPAYDVAGSIKRVLDSIFALPFSCSEYEVIVVDDCSTDNTLDVLRRIQTLHPNMTVLHQERNQRQGAARNRGIDIAKGEYIAFCDADDTIVADGVINALKAVSETKADICYFDFEYEYPKDNWNQFQMPLETRNTVLKSNDYLENYYTCYYNAPWRCLYRTDFLRRTNIRFVEEVRWEDCDWTVKVYAKANKIQFVDGVGYRYAYNACATSKQRTPEAMSERVYAGLRLMDFGREISDTSPRLSAVVKDEGRNYYVTDTIRLRNLTKYSFKKIRAFYSYIGEERRSALIKYTWNKWENLFLKKKSFALSILFFACPLASIGRKIVCLVRKR